MRTRLYHDNYPKGKVFTDKHEHDQALKNGWQTAPWLVNQETVAYMVAKADEHYEETHKKRCACGCGQEVKGTWALGHHGKHMKAMREHNDHLKNDQPPD